MLIDESHVLELRIEVSRYDSRSLFLALLKQEWEISDSFHAYIHLTNKKKSLIRLRTEKGGRVAIHSWR